MALQEAMVLQFLLWMISNFIPLLVILCVILYQYYQLGNMQDTGNPVETAEGEPDKPLHYPIQETQEPGVHQSMKFGNLLKNKMERFSAVQANRERYEREAQEEDSVVEEENKETDEEAYEDDNEQDHEDVQQELLAVACQVVDNNAKLDEGEAKTEKNEEQSSPAAKGAESAKLLLEVPGDVEHSDAATGKKRKGNKKKKKGKKAFAERTSGDHAAVADDPDTSTDESHHSSIEAFSSSDSDETDKNAVKRSCEPNEPRLRKAAFPKDKHMDDK